MKKKCQQSIPLNHCMDNEDFDRNFNMLVEESIHMKTKYVRLVQENDLKSLNTTVYNEVIGDDGKVQVTYEVNECESQIEARDALKKRESLIQEFREEKKHREDIGQTTILSNTKKSKLERKKKNSAGETRDEVILKLERDHPETKPKELWVHFKTALEEWESESPVIETGEGRHVGYQYEINGEKKSFKYNSFVRKIGNLRSKRR